MFLFCRHTASAPITAGMHTGGGAVIGKPGSAWFEGTPAMDHKEHGKRIHVQSNKRDTEHHKHQETWNMDEEHPCETIINDICILI